MFSSNWFIIQDGHVVSTKVFNLFKDDFEIGDIGLNEKGYNSKFVGFIIKNDKLLVSFPKHYFSNEKLQEYQFVEDSNKGKIQDDIKILFRVIQKNLVKKSMKSIGIRNEIDSGYPFQHFFEVYNYFLKFGLYTDEREIRKLGYSGKIDWKRTILKSPIVVSENNLVYMPMVIKKRINEHVFISKCMAYVIDMTANALSIFMNLKRTNLDIKDINWENEKLIISQLREIKQRVFKDKQKRLIDSLIRFFEKQNKGDGTIKIKTRSFDLAWESIIEFYLKHYFKHIDENGYINFSESRNMDLKPFEKKKIYPDRLEKRGRNIQPDYYLVENNLRYIFDAKYFNEVRELNYKQISYYFLLKHFEGIPNENGEIAPLPTNNVLLLPTDRNRDDERNFKKHFDLNPLFNLDEREFVIREQYLNVKYILKEYVL